ncbi:cobalamin biosynthesis protein CobG [Halodurantibacterium flavum]|uniref:Cobalamin biosynthesis protein CobG n=1 Tax=Halodurantibacterium flavum TaxID=1382802 RepID=A0ABW4S6G7_9RHOB
MRPEAKGWCPGAFRPMMSGDGLIVRVRPRLAALTAAQLRAICEGARRWGSGIIDLTNRANLQLRGVGEAGHAPLLDLLAGAGLLDPDPAMEGRRNILTQPLWSTGDDTHRIAEELSTRLAELPPLPAKFGFAIDAGPAPLLQGDPADIRVERSAIGLILRADGAARGVAVTAGEAVDRIIEMARSFAATGARRMADVAPEGAVPPLPPAARPQGLGLPFGQTDADALDAVQGDIRVTPWRMILAAPAPGFLRADDPLLKAHACAGRPFCPAATVETRALARRLAAHLPGVHVSGCAKGCAHSRPAPVTLVGREGRFDLVRSGRAWDTPAETGLEPATILSRFGAD